MKFHTYIYDKKKDIDFILKNNQCNGQKLRFNLKGLPLKERRVYNRVRRLLTIPYYLDGKVCTDVELFCSFLNKPYHHTHSSLGSYLENGLYIQIFKKEEDIDRLFNHCTMTVIK